MNEHCTARLSFHPLSGRIRSVGRMVVGMEGLLGASVECVIRRE